MLDLGYPTKLLLWVISLYFLLCHAIEDIPRISWEWPFTKYASKRLEYSTLMQELANFHPRFIISSYCGVCFSRQHVINSA